MNFLNKLDRKFGKYAVPNLINYLLIGYGIGYVLQLFNPNIYHLLELSPEYVMQGQVWRLFTWILTTPQNFSFFTIFMFLFYYWIGHTLENHWGTFRYNMYILSGYLIMTVGAMAIYWITLLASGGKFGVSLSMSTYYVNMASFLAFATLFPNVQVYFMMILPVKIKWLAIVDGIYLGYTCLYYVSSYFQHAGNYTGLLKLQFANFCFSQSAAIVLSVLNFLIFFLATRNMKKYSPKEMKRRHTYQKQTRQAQGIAKHKCAICGRTNETNPELSFRFCSKCEGTYEYCQDHIFTHEHVRH
ncbi:MAG: hypothetical protein HFH64_11455 [Lachnospiraceae bacterium]|nr:hypothetical protein [Lachnospiraceae bacterium]